MKKIISLLLIMSMCLMLFACGDNNNNNNGTTKVENESSIAKTTETGTQSVANNTTTAVSKASTTESKTDATTTQNTTTAAKNKTLVVYFSATGTTKKIAGYIATVTEGDQFEIVPTKEYTSADLNYNDNNSRSTKEQNDKNVRPEISKMVSNWDDYSTVFVGFPIWWYEEPRIMDTFVENYDFTGKNVIPFCTSASSGIGNSGKNLEGLAKGNGKWLEGKRIDANISHADMCTWVNGLGLGYNAK